MSCRHRFGFVHSLIAFALLTTFVDLRLQAQQVQLCTEVVRFLSQDMQFAARTDADTINDFRTGRKHFGCRVTAAGLTTIGLAGEATRFYERVRETGWSRTPDPWDAPNEASLRFRKNGSDCLFHVYEGALLLTEAERQVASARMPAGGQSRYGVFVMCVPVMPARPRG
jgi:hypothetical protein